MRWAMTLLANCFPEQKNLNFMRLHGGVTRRNAALSKPQEVTQFDEKEPAGGIVGGALRGDGRGRPGTQNEVAVTVVVSDIDGGARMQQIGEKHIGGESFGRRNGSAVEAAEVGLQIEEIRIGNRGVVIQDQPQRQFLGELIIQLGAVQIVVEDALPWGKRRRCPSGPRSQTIVKQRLIKAEARGRAQRKAEI